MQDCGTGSGHAGLLSDVIASPFVSGELWNGSFAAAKDSAGAACLYLAVPVRQRPRISYFLTRIITCAGIPMSRNPAAIPSSISLRADAASAGPRTRLSISGT
jgi:hypothetical protein